jgi:probable HAF family extracellular repeat protein
MPRLLTLAAAAALFASGVPGADAADASLARWQARDLGSLPGLPISNATDINSQGKFVGASCKQFGDEGQFVSCHSVTIARGKLSDLTAAIGEDEGNEPAINDLGHVAHDGGLFGHVYLWQDGVARDLGPGPGSKYGQVVDLNNRTQILGDSFNGEAFVWSEGRKQVVPTLGGPLGSFPIAMNNKGCVVGSSDGGKSTHAYLWCGGRLRDLGTLGGLFSSAADINDRGQVVGKAEYRRFNDHAFLWENGRMTDLGMLPKQTTSEATLINNRGQIVGVGYGKNDAEGAFLWDRGRMVDLGTLGGCCSVASDINERGQIVGWSKNKRGQLHAFIWEKGRMTDLGTLGGTWSEAHAINERGQIVRQSKPRTGAAHAVLWQRG